MARMGRIVVPEYPIMSINEESEREDPTPISNLVGACSELEGISLRRGFQRRKGFAACYENRPSIG
jgi:hypothetical protein